MAVVRDFDLFVGGKVGSFKGISVNLKDESKKPVVKNIQNVKVLTKEHEIAALAWGDTDEVDVLIGLSCQKVKIYDTDFKAFSSSIDVNCGTGSIKGISRYKGHLLTAVESGEVKLWTHTTEGSVLNTGNHIDKMKHSPFNSEIIATGGEKNDLKLWDFEKKVCTFSAKNVKPNMLQLKIPIWISDIEFMRDAPKVAVCTRFGHVRLYDPGTPQRRPVVNCDFPEETLTTMSVTSRDNQVVVGSGKGKLMLIDFRRKGVVCNYKGAAGAVKSVACHKTEPYVVSVGLDRHLFVHNLLNHTLIRKMYMMTRLNCVLLRSDAFCKVSERTQKGKSEDEDVKIIDEDDEEDDDYDKLFENMAKVEEPSLKKKRKIKK